MAIWVGLGGAGSGSLTQAGIDLNYSVTKFATPGELPTITEKVTPFWQDVSSLVGSAGYQDETFAQKAEPGDLIFVHVALESNNTSLYIVKDETTGQSMSCAGASQSASGCTHPDINPQASYGMTAEWIVEKPNQAEQALPDFGVETFSSAIYATASRPNRVLYPYRTFHFGIYSYAVRDPSFIDARPSLTATGVAITGYLPPLAGEGQISTG